MALLKQSTSYVRTFFMYDSSDHITPKTGLTVTVNLSKNGAAFGAAGGAVAEVSNGLYKVTLSTTDTNTVGDLAYYCTATGADPAQFVDQVGPVFADVTHWTGTAVASPDTAGYPKVTIKSGTGTGEISLSSGVASANAVQISGDSTAADNLELAYDGTGYTDGTAQAGASTSITLTAGASSTTDFYKDWGVAIVGGTGAGQAPRTITAYNGSTKVATVTPAWAVNPDNTSTYAFVNPPNVPTVVGSVGSVTSAVTVGTNNDKTGYALTSGERASVADAVWDEAISGHLTAGSTGEKLNSAASAGDPWSTALPGAYGAGTAGKIIGDNINATISSRLAAASYSPPANFSALAITAGGAVTVGTNSDKTGYSLSTAGNEAVRDAVSDDIIETQGSITRQQAESLILATLVGEWTADGTFKTANGAATRVSGTVSSVAPFRTGITLTPSS